MNRKLTDIFVVPPISVLDIKQNYWKIRKRYWLSLGIKSEVGRNGNLLSLSPLLKTKHKGTSIFDPVLCEVMYKWFSKENDIIYDPFCGGSVRGIVASKCKRNYIGIDIRDEQLESNREQVDAICNDYRPTYYNTEEQVIDEYDLFFTCPPYFNLERYSNRKDDLSNMDEKTFWIEYERILTNFLTKLKNNRFAIIVIGDIRKPDGSYMLLPQKTINIFIKNGLMFYNDLVLLQEPATAAMRAFNFMNSSRKIAKAHQNVFVFVKGNPEEATVRLSIFVDNNNINEFFESENI